MECIKYRQWNKWTKTFHYWGYLRNDDTFTCPKSGKSDACSGLPDIYGDEIYEGDIVHDYKFLVDNKPVQSIVKMGVWGWIGIPHPEASIIIGNIYENPELVPNA